MRWISVGNDGSVRILTYGEGVNRSWYGISGGTMGQINTTLGPGIFTNLGIRNQVGVRNSLMNGQRK